MRIQSPCLLRERRLTAKPRIIMGPAGKFNVERIVPSSHPSIRGKAECKSVDTFQEAIATAHEWVGPKPQENPVIAAVLAGAVVAAALIRPALNHDAELPVSHTGKARR